MKKLTLSLPVIADCDVTECGYNSGGDCHAQAITVGDDVHPACDTFFRASHHRSGSQEAGVGACKVSACRHNDEYACQASAITVRHHGDHADCTTFEMRT